MENSEITEWTIKRLRDHLGMDCHTSDHVLDVLAKEIEAQLAAEREKREKDNERCRGKLAKAQEWKNQLREQLAAEREARNSIESINKSLAQAVDQLREQAQTLVDALKELKESAYDWQKEIIDAALVKVGK